MISYEQYKGMFKDYDIVIAVDDNAEIIQESRKGWNIQLPFAGRLSTGNRWLWKRNMG